VVQVAGEHSVSEPKTLAFVCLHGMGMSRIAAAYFGLPGPHEWRAVSVGAEPGASLSPTAARLLSSTPAEAFLDHAAPRGLADVGRVDRVIALRNPTIQYELPQAETWDLVHGGFDTAMRDEIRAHVNTLVRPLGG